MKKYIYGAMLIAAVTGIAIFFFRPPETARPKPSTILPITFQLSEPHEFTEGAPFMLTWRTESRGGVLSVPVADKNFNPLVSPYGLVFTPDPDSTAVILDARLYYCDKTSRMCFQDDFETRISLDPKTPSAAPYVWEIRPGKDLSRKISDQSPETRD